MEIEIKDQEETGENEIKFEIKEEDHTFANLLVNTLQEMEEVKIAQYDIKHPKLSSPNFYLETKEKEPKEVIKKAGKEIQETIEDLENQL